MVKIVVADDEMIERKVLVKRLKQKYSEEATFFEAENGRQVLEIYEKEHPEIYILDIEMPGITGLEAAAEIRRKDPNSCIIFVTAFDDFEYARRAIVVHALDYLLKPCDEEELLLVVDSAMHYVDQIRNGQSMPLPDISLDPLQKKETAAAGISDIDAGDIFETDVRKAAMQKYIEEHFQDDISVQDIADALGYSEAYFCKIFKQYFDKNFVTYLSEYRIRKASELLKNSAVSIKEIGKAVGYPDSNYFAKVFKRVTGKSPSECRMERKK
jgi:YesN/AraC family two-component response regulator